MIQITIQCGCGQQYAFEVEPVDGRVPSGVACPACGADGTAAANEAIAQSAPPAAASPRLRVQPLASSAGSAGARRATVPLPGQMDRPQAEAEARAKILWGEPAPEVRAFLITKGMGRDEAAEIVDALLEERAAELRGVGLKKIIFGAGLMAVPVVALAIFLSLGYIYVRIFIGTLLLGAWGVWMFIGGWIIFLKPKSQTGDVTEQ
jgi:hypothetical protein